MRNFVLTLTLLASSFVIAQDFRLGSKDCYEQPSSATNCVNASRYYMNQRDGVRYCDNVASACFKDHYGQMSFYDARNSCLNVANTCYTEVKGALNCGAQARAAKICQNVNNSCYRDSRKLGHSIQSSVRACSDVRSVSCDFNCK